MQNQAGLSRQRAATIAPMKDLAFDHLLLFTRVAALGSLSAVARERDVPVSQVSRALARIEKTCGARLVHRSTHALALTAEGEIFLGYCQRITGSLEEMEAEFASTTHGVTGLVRVAASSVIAQYQILPSLKGLTQKHPQLRIELEVSDRMADLAREGIDIAIRTGTQLPETMVTRQIGELGRALYAAPSYLAAAGTPAHPDDLAQHRLIANCVASYFNDWPFVIEGKPIKLAVQGFWRCNDSSIAATMALEGLGIARIATLVAMPLVAQKRLVPVLAEFVEPLAVPIFAATASSRQRLPKIRACIDYWAQWFNPNSSV